MKQAEIEAIIKKCDFESLILICRESKETLMATLKAIDRIGVLEENILGYYACLSLLQLELTNEERAGIHHTAAFVLANGINATEGTYSLGLYHEQMCVELDPKNTVYKQTILRVFAEIPELKDMRTELLRKYGEEDRMGSKKR